MSNKILNTYAAYAFDDLIRKQSSSGAIFSLIAEKILSLSGIVYGVTMTDDCKGAEFVRVDNIEQLRQYGLLSRHFCTQICSEKLLDGGV